jgi:hypothetical protein
MPQELEKMVLRWKAAYELVISELARSLKCINEIEDYITNDDNFDDAYVIEAIRSVITDFRGGDPE